MIFHDRPSIYTTYIVAPLDFSLSLSLSMFSPFLSFILSLSSCESIFKLQEKANRKPVFNGTRTKERPRNSLKSYERIKICQCRFRYLYLSIRNTLIFVESHQSILSLLNVLNKVMQNNFNNYYYILIRIIIIKLFWNNLYVVSVCCVNCLRIKGKISFI